MLHMTTTNRAQLAAAIKAVDQFTDTVIEAVSEAVSEAGKVLCRYKFPAKAHPILIAESNAMDRKHQRHIKRIAGNVMKTPAAYWR